MKFFRKSAKPAVQDDTNSKPANNGIKIVRHSTPKTVNVTNSNPNVISTTNGHNKRTGPKIDRITTNSKQPQDLNASSSVDTNIVVNKAPTSWHRVPTKENENETNDNIPKPSKKSLLSKKNQKNHMSHNDHNNHSRYHNNNNNNNNNRSATASITFQSEFSEIGNNDVSSFGGGHGVRFNENTSVININRNINDNKNNDDLRHRNESQSYTQSQSNTNTFHTNTLNGKEFRMQLPPLKQNETLNMSNLDNQVTTSDYLSKYSPNSIPVESKYDVTHIEIDDLDSSDDDDEDDEDDVQLDNGNKVLFVCLDV